jgi:hypothetical protein
MDFTSNIGMLKSVYDQWGDIADVQIDEESIKVIIQLTVNEQTIVDKTPFADVRAQYIRSALLSLVEQHKSTLLNEAKTEIENELAAIKALADTTP